MSGNGTTKSHQARDDQGYWEQTLSAPYLSDDTARYLGAYVAPEKRAEDQMLDWVIPVKLL